jgi:hypothetical protein
MKYIQLFILIAVVVSSPATVARTSVSSLGDVKTIKNAVQTKFGLSGEVTHFKPEKSIIVIDKVIYWLRAGLVGVDLKPGQDVMFNSEQSTKEKIGRITRIWVKEKKGE